MKFIYQIGRFDENYMREINFKIDDKIYPSSLSSISLKNYFQDKVKLILIYPVSIVYNERAVEKLKSSDQFAKEIAENIQYYLKNPKEALKLHPHNKEADDFLVIHSIGEYKLGGNSVKFEATHNTYDDIVLGIFCDIVERFLEEKNNENEFYIDVSSGHNIYVSAILEALRHFAVFSQLLNWQNKNLRPKTFIAFSDPILGSFASEFQIYIQPVNFKVFFSSPVNKDDINRNRPDRLSKRLYGDNREKKNKLDDFLERFAIFYSALKNNTPLALYHFGYHGYDEIINFLKEIIGEIKDKLSKDWIKSPNLSKNDYLKVILSLGFYAGIVEVLQNNNIIKYDLEKGAELDEIRKKFGSGDNSIYKIFNLDLLIPILGREIYNLSEGGREDKKLIEKVGEEWGRLDSYLYGEGQNFEIRNFLAHAGFERTVTEVRKDNDKLYFRYCPNEVIENRVKSSLKEYLGG